MTRSNAPWLAQDQSHLETSPGAYASARKGRNAAGDAPLSPSAAVTAFVAALDRIERTIDEETTRLLKHQPLDLQDFNARKSRSLLELVRLSRALPAIADEGVRQRLRRLQSRLHRNRDVLKLNLDAVREIGDLLLSALGEAESDGTYQVPHHHKAGPR